MFKPRKNRISNRLFINTPEHSLRVTLRTKTFNWCLDDREMFQISQVLKEKRFCFRSIVCICFPSWNTCAYIFRMRRQFILSFCTQIHIKFIMNVRILKWTKKKVFPFIITTCEKTQISVIRLEFLNCYYKEEFKSNTSLDITSRKISFLKQQNRLKEHSSLFLTKSIHVHVDQYTIYYIGYEASI